MRDGRVLLVHRHPSRRWYPDCWDLVGGHVEPGELAHQAVTRECLEELDVRVHDPLPFPMPVGDPTLDVHAFLVTQWDGEPVKAAPEEHDDLRWFRPSELAQLTLAHPAQPVEQPERDGPGGRRSVTWSSRREWLDMTKDHTTPAVCLRSVEDEDLDVFFDHQADRQAVEMAAFPARDKDQFAAHWARVRADDTLVVRTIVADGKVAGHIGSWPDDGQRLLGYWLGREFWGRGVATQALAQLVDEVPVRPLYAHVAVHNVGSIRVLEKCGFRRDRAQEGNAPTPDDGVEELIFVLGS